MTVATRDTPTNSQAEMLNKPSPEHPFDAFRALLAQLPPASATAIAAVRARDAQLTKPPGSLGRLEELVEWLAAWQDKAEPTLDRPTVVVFAGNHGVVAQGVSPYPASVTAQMLKNFSAGGASVNQICATYGAGLKVFELALDLPTRDITEAPAMDDARMRRDRRLRHGSHRRRRRSAGARRNGHRQHHRRRRHLSRPLWR